MNTIAESPPLISIITPVYNAEHTILETIRSAQNQTYVNWEMILVDDASKDRSVEVIKEAAAQDQRLQLVSLPQNQGAAHARNEAMDHSKGEFIAFLDSDDRWESQKLEIQLKQMLEQNWAFSFTDYKEVDEDGEFIRTSTVDRPFLTYHDLLKHNDIGCLTVMIDKSKVGKMKMNSIKARQDYVLWLALTKKGFHAYHINCSLAWYKQSSQSLSSNKLEMAKLNWKVYRHIEGLSWWKSGYYFTHYVINKLWKYRKGNE